MLHFSLQKKFGNIPRIPRFCLKLRNDTERTFNYRQPKLSTSLEIIITHHQHPPDFEKKHPHTTTPRPMVTFILQESKNENNFDGALINYLGDGHIL